MSNNKVVILDIILPYQKCPQHNKYNTQKLKFKVETRHLNNILPLINKNMYI